jgi:class 3 adenylate cyclase
MTAAAIVCTSCGAEPARAGARFCDACGGALPAADLHAEFKQVTVLFADVVGSMDIAAAAGAERLREIMGELVGRSATVVHQFGGTMNNFTGDGLMAIFGAPAALEDHAIRACLASLDMQTEARRLADEIRSRDGIELSLRIGLNSGQVVAGEIGSGVPGYTAIGEQVGLAQRMESIAPPGGVMLSESTARLVEHAAVLDATRLVRVKGAADPLPARRLRTIGPHRGRGRGTESTLIGRESELAALEAMIMRSLSGRGVVAGVEGPPGIGKSRLAREAAVLAAARGVGVVWTFCESHASEIPFHVVTRLLRATIGIEDVDARSARIRVRAQLPHSDPQDLLLLDDLLGIADPEEPLPNIAPDARRRRLTALINAASMARTASALYVIDDAQWIDEVSEAMLSDFLAGIPASRSMVLITYRPEYQGLLRTVPGAQPISLPPLRDSQTLALLDEMLGADPSVADLASAIGRRASGNPFFAEEMVRDLVQRGVLSGNRGSYSCRADAAEVTVPATVQAAIEARIDRLHSAGKRTLNAAAVIGSRFDAQLLTALGIEAVFDELLRTELIDQVGVVPRVEYSFRHPLIRAVAYESQLQTDRAELHQRLAAAIEARSPESADSNAALIAEHLEAAGELNAAYGWRMRAGGWSTNRDIAAARVNWERARLIADALPADDVGRTAMRIAPRTMLCVSSWRAAETDGSGDFEELRQLCTAAGDKASLAIAMTGLITDMFWHGRAGDASRLATEQMALLESIGDPNLTIGAAYVPMSVQLNTGQFGDVLQWSQRVIDLSAGDASKGANFAMGSPLAAALEFRGFARCSLGRPGWRQDLDDAVAMARDSDPATHALIGATLFGLAIESGALRTDRFPVREIEDALHAAEGSSGDTALGPVKLFIGVALMQRSDVADRQRGLELVVGVRDMWLRERSRLYLVPAADVVVARERARRGDRAVAIPVMRTAVEELFQTGQLGGACAVGTAVLVETLLDCGADDNIAEAKSAIERLANIPAYEGWAVRDVWLLRLRALLARTIGDDEAYRDFVHRYRTTAESLGFEGHIAMADAM